MKLLDKKTIINVQSLERKDAIDEGVKIARRIDALRETYSQEQAKLAKFRIETLELLHKDIDTLIKQKESLIDEIAKLRSDREIIEKIKNIIT